MSSEHTSELAESLAADVRDRFLDYVRYDTQALFGSGTYPSNPKQLELSRRLVDDLHAAGVADAALDDNGYVMATIEATAEHEVPVLGFLAHVDTSPEAPGAGVNTQVLEDYDGSDIVLSGNPSQVIKPDEHPALRACVGRDVITTDGTTLLGADDKAGVAAIVSAVRYLVAHPEIPHGPLRIAFTLDEEVGAGVEHFDVAAFGAEVAYTLDGSSSGEIQDETFTAYEATVTFTGVNTHPGYALGKMKNAARAAAAFVASLPAEQAPETTAGRDGFLHPYDIEASVGSATTCVFLRDFDEDLLAEKAQLVRDLAGRVAEQWGVEVDVDVRHQYSNMKVQLDKAPLAVETAAEAVRRAGLEPKRTLIRGGTDGAMLTAKGLPTPNLFTGMHAIHSFREWVCVQDMADAAATVIHLVQIWSERSAPGA